MKRVFDTDKQLTNSGHLTTVNHLHKALRMRDNQGGKSFFDRDILALTRKSHYVGLEEVVQ